MASDQELKNAKELGKILRASRQNLGLSLLSIANQSGISMAKLNAVENGNHFGFINNSKEMYEYATIYAKTLKIEIPEHLGIKHTNQVSVTNSAVFIPYFLRKKNYDQ